MSIPLSRTYKRVVQLELNEISDSVVHSLCRSGDLPCFNALRERWSCLATTSESEYHLIEPWIQWVTAHTGLTYDEHKIFRLGDQALLAHPQIWETLSTHRHGSAIVGSMNAVRRGWTDGVFFPDPWAPSNEAYPPELSPLWKLISRKVQGHAAGAPAPGDLVEGLRACLRYRLPLSLYARIGAQLARQKLDPSSRWRLVGVFDQFLSELFLNVLASTRFSFYTLFLNSVAHYQHHYWRNFAPEQFNSTVKAPDCGAHHNPVLFGYRNLDRILARLLPRIEDGETLVVIASGLSQVPYLRDEEKGGMNYYRLRDHAALCRTLGLNDVAVFPLMSRDWQVQAKAAGPLERARAALSSLTVNGEALFSFGASAPNALFMETAVTRAIPQDAQVVDRSGRSIGRFSDLFINTAVKSGHHTGRGMLWISDPAAREAGAEVPLTALAELTLSALGVGAETRARPAA